jgi:hypothetical protein
MSIRTIDNSQDWNDNQHRWRPPRSLVGPAGLSRSNYRREVRRHQNCRRLDHPKRLTADANAQRWQYGGDTSARCAINMATQRCPKEIDTSARWHVAQSAENDATAASSSDGELRVVQMTDARSRIAEFASGDFSAAPRPRLKRTEGCRSERLFAAGSDYLCRVQSRAQ